MTLEEAKKSLASAGYIVGAVTDVSLLAIELMKADAMQRQADAIEKIGNTWLNCTVGTTFSGKRAFVVQIDK
jgi:hypothetical protein